MSVIEPPCHEILWKRVGHSRVRRMRFTEFEAAQLYYRAKAANPAISWVAWNEISVRQSTRSEATPSDNPQVGGAS